MVKSAKKDNGKGATPTPEKQKLYSLKDLATAQKAVEAATDTKDKLEKYYQLIITQKKLIDQLIVLAESKVIEADLAEIRGKFTHLEIEGVEIGAEAYSDNTVTLKLSGHDKPGVHDAIANLRRIGNKALKMLVYHQQADFTGKQIDQAKGHGAKEKKEEKQAHLV